MHLADDDSVPRRRYTNPDRYRGNIHRRGVRDLFLRRRIQVLQPMVSRVRGIGYLRIVPVLGCWSSFAEVIEFLSVCQLVYYLLVEVPGRTTNVAFGGRPGRIVSCVNTLLCAVGERSRGVTFSCVSESRVVYPASLGLPSLLRIGILRMPGQLTCACLLRPCPGTTSWG